MKTIKEKANQETEHQRTIERRKRVSHSRRRGT